MRLAGATRPSRGVAFESEASDLVAGDRNGVIDTFVYDRSSGRVRAATRPGSEPGPVGSRGAAISREGRYVAFYTPERYDPADADAFGDAYLFDRRTGRREAVSPGTGDCYNQLTLALTPRARHVLHWCNDGLRLYDRGSGEVVPVSPFDPVVSAAGVSADGGTVVFCTGADQLEPPGALGDSVFVWRRGGAGPVSLANAGVCTDSATVSADARTAIFSATMPGLVPADTGDPRQSDVFAAEPLG
jgi:hypothetical protein